MQNPQYVKLAAETLKARIPADVFSSPVPPCGVILGTGLSSLKDDLLQGMTTIPFSDLPHFPLPGVPSHAGVFSAGIHGGMPLLVQQGRCHLYEGRTPAEICMGVRVMHEVGCKTLIITNAAGALNPLFTPGSLMCMADMINFTRLSPLTGENYGGDRFPDMSCPFDPALRKMATDSALYLGIPLEHGVYIQVHGPEMETPAETRMYRAFGADAIGMSTVLEVVAARHLGMACLGLSCLTNKNLPDCMTPSPIEEVLRVAGETGLALARLLVAIFEKMARAASKP